MARPKSTASPNSERLNEYANSLFAQEHLPEGWLKDCERYARQLFGDSPKGKVVVDYGFGRGNWALTFHRLGADKVIAIDASADNVARLRSYCTAKKLSTVEVLHADVVAKNFSLQADFVWVYGVLQHIPQADLFLERIRQWAASPQAQYYFYYYNAEGPRHFLVEACRSLLKYDTAQAFNIDAPTFIRAARLRARDDLTAPHIDWATAQGFQEKLAQKGFHAVRQDLPFEDFLRGKPQREFSPHQFLCALKSTKASLKSETFSFAKDLSILRDLFDRVSGSLSLAEKRQAAQGLFNTYFAAIGDNDDVPKALTELFVYLADWLLRKHLPVSKLAPDTRATLEAWQNTLAGAGAPKAVLRDSVIFEAVTQRRLRIA